MQIQFKSLNILWKQFKDATERIGRQRSTTGEPNWVRKQCFGQDHHLGQQKEESPYLSSSNEEHSDKDFPEQLVCYRCRRA